MNDAVTVIAGEAVRLLAERALYWERERALIVADLHWGKAATFRAGGIPIPGGTTREDLGRLAAALRRTGAKRLILLGDLFHAREGRAAAATLATISAWRAAHATLDVLLVRGNHDVRAGDPPDALGISVVNAPHLVAPFALCHEPGVSPDGYVLAGHIHPGYVVYGAGRQSARLPCFVLGTRGAILPAFGSFTGTMVMDTRKTDRIYVVAGDEVISVHREGIRGA